MSATLKYGALARVNEVRRVLGVKELDDLPKGLRHESLECPIARSFEDIAQMSIDDDTLYVDDWRLAQRIGRVWGFGSLRSARLPTEIREFVSAFDRGLFPELVL